MEGSSELGFGEGKRSSSALPNGASDVLGVLEDIDYAGLAPYATSNTHHERFR